MKKHLTRKILISTLGLSLVSVAGVAVFIENSQKIDLSSNSINQSKLLSATETQPNGKYFFRPSTITLDTSKPWNSNKFASQVNANDIRALFSLSKTTYSGSETAAENRSGYSFVKMEGTEYTPIDSSTFNTQYGFNLGSYQESSIKNLIVNITKVNNADGTIEFKVYQPISGYSTDSSGNINPDRAGASVYKDLLSVITPPTNYASTRDSSVWTLPSTLSLKKVKYTFDWAPSEQIEKFIKTSRKNASEITQADVRANFLKYALDFYSSEQLEEIAKPTPTIALSTNDSLGRLDVTVSLNDSFSNTQKTYKRSFFGFSNTSLSDTQLNMVNNKNLLDATINMPFWDEEGTTETLIGQKISTLLPSQFVNTQKRFGLSFLDVFNGTIKTATDSNGTSLTKSALSIPSNKNKIGFLTYLGLESGARQLEGLPSFIVKKVDTYPNDTEGTLQLAITYQTISSSGELIDAPIYNVKFTGFSVNKDSGNSLYFSWLNTLPSRYASLSASGIVNAFKQTLSAEQASAAGNPEWSTETSSKLFVASFFNSSDFILDKYNKQYVAPTPITIANDSAEGARVRVTDISSQVAAEGESRIRVEIQFARFANENNKIYSKDFQISTAESSLPTSLQSKIRINPEFSSTKHKFSNKYPSELTVEEIKSFFILETPELGRAYTTQMDKVIVFAIPDDKTGKIIVSLIFNEFNNSPNFEFNHTFFGFKENLLLKLDLNLTHTPFLNLSSSFLSKNPQDENSLTPADVLEALFSSLPSSLYSLLSPENIQIVNRQPESVDVKVKINWARLTGEFKPNPPKSDDKSEGTPTTPNPEGTPSTSNPATVKAIKTLFNLMQDNGSSEEKNPDESILNFKITGFTGGMNSLTNVNETPFTPGRVLSESQILWIGLGLTLGLFGMIGWVVIWILINIKKYNKKTKKLVDENKELEAGE